MSANDTASLSALVCWTVAFFCIVVACTLVLFRPEPHVCKRRSGGAPARPQLPEPRHLF
jgi:hypothetical protein